MRIAPRMLLCASAFRVGGSGAETGFDELRELCDDAGDKRSLAIGMTGLVAQQFTAHRPEASELAPEHTRLLESIGDPTLTVGLTLAAVCAKFQSGEDAEVLRLSERVITLAEGDPTKGNLVIGSPLALGLTFRGGARWCFGLPGWRDDFLKAIDMARAADATTLALVVFYTYAPAIRWVLTADETALLLTAETLALAERSGDDFALDLARCARGVVLVERDGPECAAGLAMLAEVREDILRDRFSHAVLAFIDIEAATVKLRLGDLDGAIDLSRAVFDQLFTGEGLLTIATTVFVEALLRRGTEADIQDAQAAIERLAESPIGPEVVVLELHELRSRALLAQAQRDESSYRELRDRYRTMATSLGFHGHIAAAEAMS